MVEAGTHILLLMDNVDSHMLHVEASQEEDLEVIELSNITLLLFPANTTSVLQLLHAGIIHAFNSIQGKNVWDSRRLKREMHGFAHRQPVSKVSGREPNLS